MALHNIGYAPLPFSDSQLPHYIDKYERAGLSRSKEGVIGLSALPCLQNRRVLRSTFICLILIAAGYFAYFLVFPPPEFEACPSLLTRNPTKYRVAPSGNEDQSDWAKTMRPSELMELIDLGLTPPSRLIHQSWKSRDGLPDHFQKWSNDWRRIHGTNWTYVFWTDEDNKRLVERYYIDFVNVYRDLPQEIYRADMVRNMYMHKFGGVYGDLDLVPLISLEKRITEFAEDTTTTTTPVAYLGRMGRASYGHSIPNAFMASTSPGHPFWLTPLAFARDRRHDRYKASQPEKLTGPVALRTCVKAWQRRRNVEPVKVLEDGTIYPLNWHSYRKRNHCLCRMHSPWFNEQQCNAQFPNSWTITYWARSWA